MKQKSLLPHAQPTTPIQPSAPMPLCAPTSEIAEPGPDFPKEGDAVPLVHYGGGVKEARFLCFTPDKQRCELTFSLVGRYTLDLKKNIILGSGNRKLWRCSDSHLAALRVGWQLMRDRAELAKKKERRAAQGKKWK